jgi:hypothetical protein
MTTHRIRYRRASIRRHGMTAMNAVAEASVAQHRRQLDVLTTSDDFRLDLIDVHLDAIQSLMYGSGKTESLI